MAIGACLVASWLVNFVVGPVGSNVRNALIVVDRATSGLVQVPLVVGPFYFSLVGSVLFGIGRLRCADVGWHPYDVVTGLLITLGFWAAMQPALAVWVLVTGGQLQWNDAWSASSDWGAASILIEVIAALLEFDSFSAQERGVGSTFFGIGRQAAVTPESMIVG